MDTKNNYTMQDFSEATIKPSRKNALKRCSIWQLLILMIIAFFDACICHAGNGSLDDKNIKYYGRWDFSNPQQFLSCWGGAYIKVNFNGTKIKINLGHKSNYFVKIDNGSWVTYSNVNGVVDLTPVPLSNGMHALSVAQGKD